MPHYALVASLPHLEIGLEEPFSTQEYLEKCSAWVSRHEAAALRSVLGGVPEEASSPVTVQWKDLNTQLRNAIVRQRAQARGTDPRPFLQPHEGLSGTLEKQVAEAFAGSDPAKMEMRLDQTIWGLAEGLIGQDPFGFGKLVAYGIQLQVVERWNRLDAEAGRKKLEKTLLGNTEPEADTVREHRS